MLGPAHDDDRPGLHLRQRHDVDDLPMHGAVGARCVGATVSVNSTCGWSFTESPVRRRLSTRASAGSPGIVSPGVAPRMPRVNVPMPAKTPVMHAIAKAMLATIV